MGREHEGQREQLITTDTTTTVVDTRTPDPSVITSTTLMDGRLDRVDDSPDDSPDRSEESPDAVNVSPDTIDTSPDNVDGSPDIADISPDGRVTGNGG